MNAALNVELFRRLFEAASRCRCSGSNESVKAIEAAGGFDAVMAQIQRAPAPAVETEEPKDITIHINGEMFHCDCGCNVFRPFLGVPDAYICNSCGAAFRGSTSPEATEA